MQAKFRPSRRFDVCLLHKSHHQTSYKRKQCALFLTLKKEVKSSVSREQQHTLTARFIWAFTLKGQDFKKSGKGGSSCCSWSSSLSLTLTGFSEAPEANKGTVSGWVSPEFVVWSEQLLSLRGSGHCYGVTAGSGVRFWQLTFTVSQQKVWQSCRKIKVRHERAAVEVEIYDLDFSLDNFKTVQRAFIKFYIDIQRFQHLDFFCRLLSLFFKCLM